MKKLLWIILWMLPLTIYAQHADDKFIAEQWKKVEALYKMKNYEQTLPYLAVIKSYAKKENKSPEWIRAILAENRIKTTRQNNEQAFISIRKQFDESIAQSNELEKAILNNYYAMFLWANASNYSTKSTDSFLKALGTRKQKIIDSIFNVSLKPTELLLNQKSDKWISLFSEVHNLTLTPTIYHFLSHNYLDFLNKTETKEEYNILLKNILAINSKNKYADATSYLLTRKIEMHSYNHQDWIPKIKKIVEEYPSNYNSYLLYKIAESYSDSYYNKSSKIKAIEYIQKAKSTYPQSPWLDNILRLEKQVKKAELNIEHQLFEPSKNYIPLKLTTRNADSLYIRVYKTTNTPKNNKIWKVKHDSTTFINSIDAPLVYEENIALKLFTDFENHTTIYKLNPLDCGNYTILVANNSAFKNDGEEKTVSTSSLIISDIFISASLDKETDKTDYYKVLLINRMTGKPYANKQVMLYKTSNKTIELVSKQKTDPKGEFVYKSTNSSRNNDIDDLEIYIPEENQLIDLMELEDIAEHAEESDDGNEGDYDFQTMLDRAIYRPGQHVYFKSILYDNHKINGKVIPNQKVNVFLYDANHQKIDSLTLTSNEFGSIHGKFTLPTQTLAGSFKIDFKAANHTYSYRFFRVEEYKRPTFKIEFETNKETYTHQDTAIFVGKVESLAGAKLSDASVRYMVKYFGNNYQEITYVDSVMQTHSEGKFYIKVPFADTSFIKKDNFSLNYSAEVTNQNGEMQQSSGSYRFSTKPWNISVSTPSYIEAGRWSEINIHTTNQNGQPLKFAGKVNIYKREFHQKPLTNNFLTYFKNAHYHLLANEQYEKYFPNYFDPKTLNQDSKELIASYNFDTNDTTFVIIDSTIFKAGYYEIEAVSVFGLDTIKSVANTAIFDPETRKIADNTFFTYHLDKKNYSVGDKVTMTFQTDVENPSVVFLVEVSQNKKQPTKVLSWKDRKATYSFTLTDKMISPNITFNALFVNNNQASNFDIYIPILDKAKDIVIKTKSFRDKITPGQKEKWTFNVSAKDSKVATELLAAMYDSSLDVFASNSFTSQFSFYEDYTKLDFYYLTREFNQQRDSYSIFKKTLLNPELGNNLTLLHTYDLWIPQQQNYFRREFNDDNSTLNEVVVLGSGDAVDEVVVTGFGSFANQSMTTSVTRLEGSVAGISIRGSSSIEQHTDPLYLIDGEIADKARFDKLNKNQINKIDFLRDAEATALYGSKGANGVTVITTKEGAEREKLLNNVQTRTNLQETAFFYPTLYTDAEGNVSFEFDSPEALTKWKLLLFAHSKSLQVGTATFFSQTQKQLMVRPNLPRYLREADKITLKAQIQNLSKEIQKGNARIEIINPETNENITSLFLKGNNTLSFEADASKNTIVEWSIDVRKDYPSVHIKIVAATDEFSDGELQEIPILPNRVLITDTEKIILKPNQAQEYQITSVNKDNLQARIQIQTNPILEIISALDYLKNYPYECNEQIVSKWFGLKMVDYIAKNYPQISNYFKSLNTEKAEGKLEANLDLSELKAEEMPWLRDIKNDEDKLKAIAKLFHTNTFSDIKAIEQKIVKNQLPNGGFSWFDGGKENFDISTRMLEVMGKALKLDPTLVNSNLRAVAEKLANYLDTDTTINSPFVASYIALDYLYARHYWNGLYPLSKEKANKLQSILQKSSLTTAKQSAGVAAKSWITNQLFGTGATSNEIKNRISQEAVNDTLRGMYWESNSKYYNSISLQSYMVEAFKLHDQSKLHDITQWIYYNKQANNWHTTWMTVDAIYALLLANNPKDFVVENAVKVWVNNIDVEQNKTVLGQFTNTLNKTALNENQHITVQNNNSRSVYGNIVHQYFSKLEDIKKSVEEIAIQKQYFVEREGKWIQTSEAKLGERIKVKIRIISDNAQQYVHLQDARPSGVEPIFQPSGYKWWQGYYFSIKDASTNYFFDNLRKGLTELEYEVKANNVGELNSGITTMECMYDPSVNARSANNVLRITE